MAESTKFRVAYIHPRTNKPMLRKVHGKSVFDKRTGQWATRALGDKKIVCTLFQAGNEEAARTRIIKRFNAGEAF